MSQADAAAIVERVVAAGHETMLESEGYALLAALGVRTPRFAFVTDAQAVAGADLPTVGRDVVVKMASRAIPHKSDVGGVAIVRNRRDTVTAAIDAMARRLAGVSLEGFLVSELVAHPAGMGGELLVSLRRTDDFGPVVTVGPGGIQTELLAASLRPGDDIAVFASSDTPASIGRRLSALPVTRAAAGRTLVGTDGGPSDIDALARLIQRLLHYAWSADSSHVAELEMNPVTFVDGEPVALDVLVRLCSAVPSLVPPRPLAKLARLLQPRSVAIVGVSDGMNPGRAILQNVLRAGYPADQVAVVKPGVDVIDGVRCHPSLSALPAPVDLCVLAVAARQIPDLVDEIVNGRRAESIIVIPGGLGERAGSATLERRVRDRLVGARASEWGGPLLNGGNCLGIRSEPGGYDTTFIPESRLGPRSGVVAPLALIAQSGAFAVARWSKLGGATPRYLISVGNQTDLTVGDYLTYLRDDAEVRVFACYVEGFRPQDGAQWLTAASDIVRSGRTVILYRGARTNEGRAAGVSHTAALAGDYVVTRELAERAGVLVAESLEEFDDLLRTASLLDDRPLQGATLGAVTNAGFECVAIGDALDGMRLATLSARTTERLAEVLARYRLDGIVEVGHPLDLTPMMSDDGFADIVTIVLDDDAVDVAVVGIVPLTSALRTLSASLEGGQRLDGPGTVLSRLARLRQEHRKPFVAVVDAGAPYDPLAAGLEEVGIPTFRTMDRAVHALARLAPRPVRDFQAELPALAGSGASRETTW